jgi:hypothetical protein
MVGIVNIIRWPLLSEEPLDSMMHQLKNILSYDVEVYGKIYSSLANSERNFQKEIQL